MMITEATREAIDAELEQLNRDHWLQLVSQVHYHGKEGNFWFLVAGPEMVPEAIRVLREPLRRAAERFDETRFSASFSQKTATERVIWETMDDDDIRGEFLPSHPSTAPSRHRLTPHDVFGPNQVPD